MNAALIVFAAALRARADELTRQAELDVRTEGVLLADDPRTLHTVAREFRALADEIGN